jgi:hypothetical protein
MAVDMNSSEQNTTAWQLQPLPITNAKFDILLNGLKNALPPYGSSPPLAFGVESCVSKNQLSHVC